ncbi:uncharacterized protein FPRO_10348 [Fusarium proliferatum ET1]|uniref:Uncharacterized protein n=1 Tax=Fusarium proliferatum (strain ET1) TaxID=1227346 RepID=A0A1L7VM37_FUSPR|nr:uncharacterized protein FPRO_10348 [Fusarium proliferatum ET1]CZR40760.1 uncharacterized protein FPRO_10348 [Fusarium proliferatum ET1]
MSEPRGSNGTRPQPGQKESTKTKKRPEMKAKTPVSESARAVAKSYLEARPRLLPKDLGEIMRPDPAVEFSRESPEIERGAMKLYDASNEKEDYENFNPDLNTPVVKEFKALWKVCLRVWRISPIALMSPMCGLKYFPLGSGRKRANQAVFSPEFSKLFATLITHPCWELEHEGFVLALQYLVKCRVDNRNPWPHKDAKERECPAIDALFNMFDGSGSGDRSLLEMQKSARQSIVGGGVSVFSDFLDFIGQQVKKDDTEQEKAYLDVPALPVTLGDIKALTDAVTNFNWPDETWRCSPGDVYSASRAERTTGKTEFPTTGAELKEYLGRSLKDVFRDIETYKQDANPETCSPANEADHGHVLAGDAEDVIPPPGPDTAVDEEMGIPEDNQNVPPESNPVRPEHRYRALVDGEESEDEQADLARNQANKRTASRSPPHPQSRQRGSGYAWGDRNFSEIRTESPYERFELPRRQVRTSLQEATPHPSAFISSQILSPTTDPRPEKRIKVVKNGQQCLASHFKGAGHDDIQEIKSTLRRIENQTTQILNKEQSQPQDTHQPVVYPVNERRYSAGRTRIAEAAPTVC